MFEDEEENRAHGDFLEKGYMWSKPERMGVLRSGFIHGFFLHCVLFVVIGALIAGLVPGPMAVLYGMFCIFLIIVANIKISGEKLRSGKFCYLCRSDFREGDHAVRISFHSGPIRFAHRACRDKYST